jgi:hypothetical protein
MVDWCKTDVPTRVEALQQRHLICQMTEEVCANTGPKNGFEHIIMIRSTRA